MSAHQTNPLAKHVAAFERGDRKEFWRLVREERANTPQELAVVYELLNRYADSLLDGAHERWNRRIGAFVHALGLCPEGGLAEDWLTRCQPEWAGSYRDNAFKFAQAELRHAYDTGAKLTVSYAHELIYIGWRIDYLDGLEAIVKANPTSTVTALIEAPFVGPGGARARLEAAAGLPNDGGSLGDAKVLGDLMDADYWWEVWGPFKPESPADQQPDTALRALELLRERASKSTS